MGCYEKGLELAGQLRDRVLQQELRARVNTVQDQQEARVTAEREAAINSIAYPSASAGAKASRYSLFGRLRGSRHTEAAEHELAGMGANGSAAAADSSAGGAASRVSLRKKTASMARNSMHRISTLFKRTGSVSLKDTPMLPQAAETVNH